MANNKTSNIYIRIEPEVKQQAEEILGALGIGASQAVNMFYKQIILHQGMPFDVKVPIVDDIKVKPKTISSTTRVEDKSHIKVETGSKIDLKKEEIIVNKTQEETAKEKEERTIAEIKKKYGL